MMQMVTPSLNATGKKIKKETVVFGFLVVTVKMLRFLKDLVAEAPMLHIQIDGTY